MTHDTDRLNTPSNEVLFVKGNPYLQVEWLCSRCLDLHGEACVLDYYHFLFIGLLSSVCLAVPILLCFCLLSVLMIPITIHHGCICTVSCMGRNTNIINQMSI